MSHDSQSDAEDSSSHVQELSTGDGARDPAARAGRVLPRFRRVLRGSQFFAVSAE